MEKGESMIPREIICKVVSCVLMYVAWYTNLILASTKARFRRRCIMVACLLKRDRKQATISLAVALAQDPAAFPILTPQDPCDQDW